MAEAKKLADAFLAAQKEFHAIHKDKVNSHYKSKYASLDAIQSAVVPVLNKHGLTLSYGTVMHDGNLSVSAIVEHVVSAEKITNCMTMAVADNIHEIGSRITYLRRYAVTALLAVCADEDDDGNAAASKDNEKAEFNRWAMQLVNSERIQPTQIKAIVDKHKGNYVAARQEIEKSLNA